MERDERSSSPDVFNADVARHRSIVAQARNRRDAEKYAEELVDELLKTIEAHADLGETQAEWTMPIEKDHRFDEAICRETIRKFLRKGKFAYTRSPENEHKITVSWDESSSCAIM